MTETNVWETRLKPNDLHNLLGTSIVWDGKDDVTVLNHSRDVQQVDACYSVQDK